MRWLFLLLVPIGAASKEVEIPCMTWYEGHITACDAVLVAEVVEADSQVIHSPGQMLLKEFCILRLQDVIGATPELEAATTIRLRKEYPHDLYQQIEPDWGDYRHLRTGQQVVVLVHHYEHNIALGSDAVIALNAETRTLPEILKRTNLNLSLFTDGDLAVWKVASPRMFPELAARVTYERKRLEEELKSPALTPRGWLMISSGALSLLAAVMWIFKTRTHRSTI